MTDVNKPLHLVKFALHCIKQLFLQFFVTGYNGKKMTSEKIRPKLISYCRKALWRQRWPWASFTLICHCVPNFSQWIKPVIWGQLNTDSCGQAFSFGPHKLGVCELKHTPTYLLCTVTEVIATICSARNTLKSHCWTQT